MKTLFSTKFLSLIEKDNWVYVERANATGVVGIIALTTNNEVLLVEQFRIPANADVIELPAGLCGDHGIEEMADAAQRELLEETGYNARTLVKLAEPVAASAGLTSETCQLFLAKDLEQVNPGCTDPLENIIVHKVPLKNLFEWSINQTKSGKVIDSKVYSIPAWIEYVKLSSDICAT